jgi:hypothetical protein
MKNLPPRTAGKKRQAQSWNEKQGQKHYLP